MVLSVIHASHKYKCIFCDRSHLIPDYGKASMMSKEDKIMTVIRKKCCLVCLRSDYIAKACHSVRCPICEKRHYVILSPQLPKKKSNFKAQISIKEDKTTLFTDISSQGIIYLKYFCYVYEEVNIIRVSVHC